MIIVSRAKSGGMIIISPAKTGGMIIVSRAKSGGMIIVSRAKTGGMIIVSRAKTGGMIIVGRAKSGGMIIVISGFFFRTQVKAEVRITKAVTRVRMRKKKPVISNTGNFFCFNNKVSYLYNNSVVEKNQMV